MATDDLKARLDAFAIDCDRDDHCNTFIEAADAIATLEAQLAARDAEIAAWLMRHFDGELSANLHVQNAAKAFATAIERGDYRKDEA